MRPAAGQIAFLKVHATKTASEISDEAVQMQVASLQDARPMLTRASDGEGAHSPKLGWGRG